MKLSTIIITRNEQDMIQACLDSVRPISWEIIVVDSGNTDRTNALAKKSGARIITSSGTDYSQFRNDGLKAARGDWVLYVDADERVTSELAAEISSLSRPGVYQLPRANIYLGRKMNHGGWGDDKVIRLFYKKYLTGYRGQLHEQPVFSARLQTTRFGLVHYSHRDLSSMLAKTLIFTDYEAKLRLRAHHPRVVPWRILRVMLTEFWHRFIRLSAWKDGPAGIIDGMFQVFNAFVIYARLWEMQNDASKVRR